MKYQEHQPKGFTLIEVVIALSVVSILLVSLVAQQSKAVNSTAYLTEKMVADIVAKNVLDEHRLRLDKLLKAPVSNKTENIEMAGYVFRVEKKVLPAALPGLKKIVVDVYAADENRKASLRTLDLYVGD